MGQVQTLYFKSINQSKKGAIFTEQPATVKKQIPVGTAVDLVVTDKAVVNNTTKQTIKNLFWAYAQN